MMCQPRRNGLFQLFTPENLQDHFKSQCQPPFREGPNVRWPILILCRRFHTSLPWERFYCERSFDAGNNGYQQCSIHSIVHCTPIVAKNIPPLIHKRQEGKIKSHWKTIDFCVYLFESEIIQLIIHLTIDWCVCIWWVSQPLIDHSKHEDVD